MIKKIKDWIKWLLFSQDPQISRFLRKSSKKYGIVVKNNCYYDLFNFLSDEEIMELTQILNQTSWVKAVYYAYAENEDLWYRPADNRVKKLNEELGYQKLCRYRNGLISHFKRFNWDNLVVNERIFLLEGGEIKEPLDSSYFERSFLLTICLDGKKIPVRDYYVNGQRPDFFPCADQRYTIHAYKSSKAKNWLDFDFHYRRYEPILKNNKFKDLPVNAKDFVKNFIFTGELDFLSWEELMKVLIHNQLLREKLEHT